MKASWQIRGWLALALAACVAACGGEPAGTAPEASSEPATVDSGSAGEVPIAGLYEVSGRTIEVESGREREVVGTIILTREGPSYTSTFSLRTMLPTPSGPLPAEMIGKGQGTVESDVLTGTADTQIVMSTVAGVDAGFAYVPRRVTERIVSKSVAKVTLDGKVSVEITSEPVEGAAYPPSRTILEGERVTTPDTAAVPLRRP